MSSLRSSTVKVFAVLAFVPNATIGLARHISVLGQAIHARYSRGYECQLYNNSVNCTIIDDSLLE
jgi:hypothetical protein